MIGFDQLATVYVPNDEDGDYTVVAKKCLVCRLAHVGVSQSPPADERAEVAHKRRLMWDPNYEMPPIAQVGVEGKRWHVQPETVEAIRGPSSNVVYRRGTVVIVL